MQELLKNYQIKVNDKTFIKDPETSDLGKRIITHSLVLMNDIGFDDFTFKKLGDLISSNESSVYRYFENKHKLLLYLTSWYWSWVEYQIVLQTYSISNTTDKLKKTIKIVISKSEKDTSFPHIDIPVLNKIVISEFSKSILTKDVDTENKEGYFLIYKRLIARIKEAIVLANPEYRFPNSLASSFIDGSLHQHYLAAHFPSLTNCNDDESLFEFYSDLIFNALNIKIDE